MPKTRRNQRRIERRTERINRGRRIYIGALARLTGNALREQARTGLTPRRLRILDWALSQNVLQLAPLAPGMRDQIAEVMRRTAYWHGTGRYQYRDGKVVDVLNYIAKHHELQPSPDPFEASGHMQSLSLARARIYARAYADLHRNAVVQAERHGSPAFWSVVFLSDYVLEAAREEGGLRRVIKRLQQSGKDEWYSKVNQQSLSVFASFAAGSDIPGNYPILFGISSANEIPTSRAIAIHEIRVGQPINLDTQVTHIEVPRANIAETEKVLSEHHLAIAVLAIEDFERFAATFPVSKLMDSNFKL